jgi:hypothetical protein
MLRMSPEPQYTHRRNIQDIECSDHAFDEFLVAIGREDKIVAARQAPQDLWPADWPS